MWNVPLETFKLVCSPSTPDFFLSWHYPKFGSQKKKHIQYILSAFYTSACQSAHFWTNQLHVAFIQSSFFPPKSYPPEDSRTNDDSSSTYPAVNPLLTPRKINKHGTYKSPIFVQRKMIWTKPPWLSSWWFQPIWKILVKLDHFPKDPGWK